MPAVWWHFSTLLMNFRSFAAFSGLSSLSSPKQTPTARIRRTTCCLFKDIVNHCVSHRWRVYFRKLGPSTKSIYACDTAYKYLFAIDSTDSCLCRHWMCSCVRGFVWMVGECVYACVSRFVNKRTKNPSSRNSAQ